MSSIRAFVADNEAIVWAKTAGKARMMVARYLNEHGAVLSIGDALKCIRVIRAPAYDDDSWKTAGEVIAFDVVRGRAHPDEMPYAGDLPTR